MDELKNDFPRFLSELLLKHHNQFYSFPAGKSYGHLAKEISTYKNAIETHSDLEREDFILLRPNLKSFDQYWPLMLGLWATGKKIILLSPDHSDTEVLKDLPPHLELNPEEFSLVMDNGQTIQDFTSKLSWEEPALLIPSSGTTAAPKIIAHSLKGLLTSAQGSVDFYQLKQSDVLALTLPLYRVGGLMILWRALLAGASLYAIGEQWRKNLSSRVSTYSFVPAQLYEILKNDELLSQVKHAKRILIGGAKIEEDLFFQGLSKGLKISLSYGMTETASQIAATYPGEESFAGHILPQRSIQLGENGQIHLSGDSLFLGLYKKGVFVPRNEGLYQTQDKGELTKEGNLIVKGRLDRVIISGGINVSLNQVESYYSSKIKSDFDISFYALPFLDKKFGEKIHLVYATEKRGLSLSERDQIEHQIKAYSKIIPPEQRPTSFSYLKKSAGEKITKKMATTSCEEYEFFNNLPFVSKGIGISSSSPVFVFLHGFMGSPFDFTPLMNHWQRRGKVIGLTLPFHELNKDEVKSPPKNFNEVCEILAKTLDEIYDFYERKIIVMGYSMGGRILMQTLCEYPKLSPRIQHAIFHSASPGLRKEWEREERIQKDKALFNAIKKGEKKEWPTFFSNWYQSQLFGDLWQNPSARNTLEARLFRQLRSFSGIELKERWQSALNILSVGRQKNLWPKLKNLRMPVSFIYGTRDFKYAHMAMEAVQNIREHQENVWLKSFEGGHAFHLENQLQSQEELMKWIESYSAISSPELSNSAIEVSSL